jgi:hypothetical protein
MAIRNKFIRVTTDRSACCMQAYDLLAPVYDWFAQGFDTLDLKEAKELLEQLKA